MPLVRIGVQSHIGPETKKAISDCVHRALVEEFGVPQDGKFHLIDEYKPENMITSSHYLGVDHKDNNFVVIQIFAGTGRDVAKKEALYKKMANLINDAQKEIAKENILINIVELNALENFSYGLGDRQLPPHLRK